jgi:hypothetical protein
MTFSYSVGQDAARLLEESADELGRLDSLVAVCPPAVPLLLQAWTVARLADPAAQATRVGCSALVASSVEMLHAAALDPALAHWQDRLDNGERNARSGVALRAQSGITLDRDAQETLTDALRPGGQPRSVLLRAVCVAGVLEAQEESTASAREASMGAASSTSSSMVSASPRAEGELLSALLLTAAGMTDRVRLLPFAERTDDGGAALEAWRGGDHQPFTQLALRALATNARRLRLQVRLLLDARPAEDDHLASIGRAAVTARRALQVLRESQATSMPDLARRLECSRPAAGDALERLVELGLAEEITGRGRDRVYVWAAAWGVA